jgi:hypothetical protein
MRFPLRSHSAAWLPLFVALGCGGSSSETPFPEPPLPAYLRANQEAEPAATTSAAPSAEPSVATSTAPEPSLAPPTWAD